MSVTIIGVLYRLLRSILTWTSGDTYLMRAEFFFTQYVWSPVVYRLFRTTLLSMSTTGSPKEAALDRRLLELLPDTLTDIAPDDSFPLRSRCHLC